MFGENENWIDKLCAVILIGGFLMAAIWWVGVYLPARDAFLWKTNDCYQSRCSTLEGNPQNNQQAKVCWDECGQVARDALADKGS